MTRVLTCSAVAVFLVLSAGCSTTSSVLDQAEVVDGTGEILDGAGVAYTSIQCPEDVEISSGDTFDCQVTAGDGTVFPMVVTMTDNDGNVNISSGPDVVLMTDDVVQEAADSLALNAGEDVSLVCPPVKIITDGTGTVTCEAESLTASGTVELTFDNSRLVSVE